MLAVKCCLGIMQTAPMEKLHQLMNAIPSNDVLRKRVALIREQADKLHRENDKTRQDNEKLSAHAARLQKGIARLEQKKSDKPARP